MSLCLTCYLCFSSDNELVEHQISEHAKEQIHISRPFKAKSHSQLKPLKAMLSVKSEIIDEPIDTSVRETSLISEIKMETDLPISINQSPIPKSINNSIDIEPKFKCQICHKKFTQQKSLAVHQLKHVQLIDCTKDEHSAETTVKPETRKPKPGEPEINNISSVFCVSLTVPDQNQSQIDDQSINNQSILDRLQDTPLTESITERREDTLKILTASETTSKSFDCYRCGRKFFHNRFLEKHLMSCGQSTKSRTRLNCKYCHKSLPADMSVLGQHLKTHTDQLPFECPQCERRFPMKCNLVRHQRICGCEKPAGGGGAQIGKINLSKLSTQEKLHLTQSETDSRKRPFACDQCGKRFLLKAHLVGHGVTHTGARPYECPNCPKTFTQVGVRNKHLRKEKCTSNTEKQKGDSLMTNSNDLLDQKCETSGAVAAIKSAVQSESSGAVAAIKSAVQAGSAASNISAHECPICSRTFQFYSRLAKHMVRVHATLIPANPNRRKYRKRQKQARTESKYEVITPLSLRNNVEPKHEFLENTQSKFFDNFYTVQCDRCPRKFKNESSLMKHSRLFHSPLKTVEKENPSPSTSIKTSQTELHSKEETSAVLPVVGVNTQAQENLPPPEHTWCICGQTSHGVMVACDNAQCKFQWFHLECVNMKKVPEGKWICLHCQYAMKHQ